VQSREAEVHLRLDADHAGHLRVTRLSGCPVEQRGLSGSGRATQDEHSAGPVANGSKHLVKGSHLVGPAQQHARATFPAATQRQALDQLSHNSGLHGHLAMPCEDRAITA
jgi:hypothetical protein